MGGAELEHLIALFARIPGLGQRSARRAVLKLLQNPQSRMLPLARALVAAAEAVKTCEICCNLDSRSPCAICADDGRERGVVCVVETVADLWALERAGVYRGMYHVLGGTLSAMGGTGPEDLNIEPLLVRVAAGGVTEVIFALSATVDGAATRHLVTDRLEGSGVRVTSVAQGVPMGGALEVLDDGTLAQALKARR